MKKEFKILIPDSDDYYQDKMKRIDFSIERVNVLQDGTGNNYTATDHYSKIHFSIPAFSGDLKINQEIAGKKHLSFEQMKALTEAQETIIKILGLKKD